MQSWERAAFVPRPSVLLGTGRRIFVGRYLTEVNPLQSLPEHERPPSDFSFCSVLMRRRSLRLLSPGTFPNSDGNTGAFFRAENYRREFCVPKTGGLNVEVFALRVNFSKGLVK